MLQKSSETARLFALQQFATHDVLKLQGDSEDDC